MKLKNFQFHNNTDNMPHLFKKTVEFVNILQKLFNLFTIKESSDKLDQVEVSEFDLLI